MKAPSTSRPSESGSETLPSDPADTPQRGYAPAHPGVSG
jgi:hypothetical protein